MSSGHGWNDAEACERAGGGDGGATEAGQVIAIGMHDLLDQSELAEARELARHGPWSEMQVRQQIGATPTVDIEFPELQSTQQRLLGGVEEIQSLDARRGTDARRHVCLL